jgi:Secretion system C-terminal sorting domain/Fibronectin type III domain
MRTILILCLFLGLTSNQDVQAKKPTLPNIIIESCNLPAVDNLHETNSSHNSISFSWDAVLGASGYSVRVSEVGFSAFPVYNNIVTTTSLDVMGLNSATTYDIVVQAVDLTGCISPNQSSINAKTQFIITDVVVAERLIPSGDSPIGCETAFDLPADLLLKGGDLILEPFRIENIDGKIIVFHANGECDSEGKCYLSGIHLGNHVEYPPLNSNSIGASIIYVYNLLESTPKDEFKLEEQIEIITLINNKGKIKICATQKYLEIWKGKKSEDGSSNNGKNLRRENVTPITPTISPNPFADDISINLGAFAGKNAELRLFDTNGKQVRSQQMGEEDQTAIMQTTDLSPGMYVLRFQNDTTSKTYKLVKMGW